MSQEEEVDRAPQAPARLAIPVSVQDRHGGVLQCSTVVNVDPEGTVASVLLDIEAQLVTNAGRSLVDFMRAETDRAGRRVLQPLVSSDLDRRAGEFFRGGEAGTKFSSNLLVAVVVPSTSDEVADGPMCFDRTPGFDSAAGMRTLGACLVGFAFLLILWKAFGFPRSFRPYTPFLLLMVAGLAASAYGLFLAESSWSEMWGAKSDRKWIVLGGGGAFLLGVVMQIVRAYRRKEETMAQAREQLGAAAEAAKANALKVRAELMGVMSRINASRDEAALRRDPGVLWWDSSADGNS